MPSALLDGAVDLYVHAAPDLMPRRGNDVAMAAELADTPLYAAVHRHHFAVTADRAALATSVTGFPLYGSILLNAAVGGINPMAVEVALRCGAVLVSLPTTSALYMQSRDSWARGIEKRLGLVTSSEPLTVWSVPGALHDDVLAVVDLVAEVGAILALVYVGPDECLAVASEAAQRGVTKMLLTNPLVAMGLSVDQCLEILSVPGTYLEMTAFALDPAHVGGIADMDDVMRMAGRGAGGVEPRDPAIPARQADLMRRVGPARCVLSSDGGHLGERSPADELNGACEVLARNGFSEEALRTMVRDNPMLLLGLA